MTGTRDLDCGPSIAEAVRTSVRRLDGDPCDWNSGSECLFSKFRSGLCFCIFVLAALFYMIISSRSPPFFGADFRFYLFYCTLCFSLTLAPVICQRGHLILHQDQRLTC
jgi:hypothetical protein